MNTGITAARDNGPAIDELETQVDITGDRDASAPLDGVATEVSHGPPAALERFDSSATQTSVEPLRAIDTEEIEEPEGSEQPEQPEQPEPRSTDAAKKPRQPPS